MIKPLETPVTEETVAEFCAQFTTIDRDSWSACRDAYKAHGVKLTYTRAWVKFWMKYGDEILAKREQFQSEGKRHGA
jgi:hypothetical protein